MATMLARDLSGAGTNINIRRPQASAQPPETARRPGFNPGTPPAAPPPGTACATYPSAAAPRPKDHDGNPGRVRRSLGTGWVEISWVRVIEQALEIAARMLGSHRASHPNVSQHTREVHCFIVPGQKFDLQQAVMV